MLRSTERGVATAGRPSVCLSVRGVEVSWSHGLESNTSKIISWLIIIGFRLSANPKITDLLPSHALNTLVAALVHSRLDYCNVLFAGFPACDIQRLQSVLNSAVRLVAGSSRRDHARLPLAACQAAC